MPNSYTKWTDLKSSMSPAARERTKRLTERMIAEMPLEQLRTARQLTQQNLAEALGVNQSAVSKIEKRTDMYLSTLRSYIEALGGKLDIQAIFPEGTVRIEGLRDQ